MFILNACAKKEVEHVEEEEIAHETTVNEEVDYSHFQGVKVKAKNHLYQKVDNQFIEVGSLEKELNFDIDTVEGKYCHINHTSFYLDGGEVEYSERWYHHQTHLLPYQTLTVKGDHTLESENNEALIHFTSKESMNYELYVLPSDEDERVGVLFADEIYFLEQSSLETPLEPVTQNGAKEIPVLMYHFFYSKENGESARDANDIEVNDFEAQLQYLKENNYATLTMKEVYYFLKKRAQVPVNALAITIDDGDPSVHEYAYPLFVKYQMNACLFLICGWEDPVMSYDFWEMREAGLELQSHGFLMHQGGCEGQGHGGRLQCVDEEVGIADTIQSLEYVDGGFVYCYPFGDYNEHAKNILKKAGVLMAFTTEYGMVNPNQDLYQLPRIRVRGDNSLNAFINSIKSE